MRILLVLLAAMTLTACTWMIDPALLTPTAEAPVISQPIATPDPTAEAEATAVMVATLEATPAPECLLKGNINSSGEKILHSPGNVSYARTVIDPERGEQWFCDVASALSEGWREATR